MFRRARKPSKPVSALDELLQPLGAIFISPEALALLRDTDILSFLVRHRAKDEPERSRCCLPWTIGRFTTEVRWEEWRTFLVVANYTERWTYITVAEDIDLFEAMPAECPYEALNWYLPERTR
jgi:hypothetical protein